MSPCNNRKRILFVPALLCVFLILWMSSQATFGGYQPHLGAVEVTTADYQISIDYPISDPRRDAITTALRDYLRSSKQPVGIKWCFLLDIIQCENDEYVVYYYSDTNHSKDISSNSLYYQAINCAKLITCDGQYSFLPFVRTFPDGLKLNDEFDQNICRLFVSPEEHGISFKIKHYLSYSNENKIGTTVFVRNGLFDTYSFTDETESFEATMNDFSHFENVPADLSDIGENIVAIKFNVLIISMLSGEKLSDIWHHAIYYSLSKE